MKINLALGLSLVILSLGTIILEIAGLPGGYGMALVSLIMGAIFAIVSLDDATYRPNLAVHGAMLNALQAASEAIHALEDPDGNMPAETGEFENLKLAGWLVDRAIDKAMEEA